MSSRGIASVSPLDAKAKNFSQRAAQALADLGAVPLLGGRLISASLSRAPISVSHGLGAAPQGILQVSGPPATVVSRDATRLVLSVAGLPECVAEWSPQSGDTSYTFSGLSAADGDYELEGLDVGTNASAAATTRIRISPNGVAYSAVFGARYHAVPAGAGAAVGTDTNQMAVGLAQTAGAGAISWRASLRTAAGAQRTALSVGSNQLTPGREIFQIASTWTDTSAAWSSLVVDIANSTAGGAAGTGGVAFSGSGKVRLYRVARAGTCAFWVF